MNVSIVVPTYERADFVARTITSLGAQTHRPMEVIVVDNGSTDDTGAVVHGLKPRVHRLRHIVEPRLGVSYARNRGAAEASGELVAFLDDDAVASPGWVSALNQAAESSPEAVAFAGPIGLRWPGPAPAWVRGLESWYGQFDLGETCGVVAYPRYPFASNVAFRREAFLSVGGFPVELGPRGDRRISNEEDGLFRRVAERGWAVQYEPRARVYHWVHPQRLSRRYLLRRSFQQGKSDVLVDALFSATRTRRRRATRSVDAVVAAVDAGRMAFARRSQGESMRALVASGTSLGRAVQDAALTLRRRDSGPGEAGRQEPAGLTAAQVERFRRDGFLCVANAFQGADAMADRIWSHLARRGVRRDDPGTWPVNDVRHLQKLLGDPVFMPIGGAASTGVVDTLLGPGRWPRPDHWGEFLVTFPNPRLEWNLPILWHTDAAYTDPLEPLAGVMVLSYLNGVGHRGGGTLVVAGSHRLVARFVEERPNVVEEKPAATRRAFYASHPWLSDLLTTGGDPDRYERFSSEADIDGLPARVVELTGQPGDIVIAHPLIAHCVSPNCSGQPRFMRIARLRVRTTTE